MRGVALFLPVVSCQFPAYTSFQCFDLNLIEVALFLSFAKYLLFPALVVLMIVTACLYAVSFLLRLISNAFLVVLEEMFCSFLWSIQILS